MSERGITRILSLSEKGVSGSITNYCLILVFGQKKPQTFIPSMSIIGTNFSSQYWQIVLLHETSKNLEDK